MRNFLDLLVRFHRDERGIFAVIFGILAIVLIATSGAVVDFTTVEQARARAQDALDSAALGLQSTIRNAGVTEATIAEQAQNLLDERLNDSRIEIDSVVAGIDLPNGTLDLRARLTIPTAFVALVGVPSISAVVASQVTRGSVNLEVALALDVTLSMQGTKISDLRAATNALIDIVVQDQQTPTYTKLALAPYSAGVNVGTYANAVRGTPVGSKTITGASWSEGSAKSITGASWAVASSARNISAITRAFPAKVTTSSTHGLTTGQTVYITGVRGMTQVNGQAFVVTVTSTTQFTLNNVNSSSYGNYTSGGTATRCQTSACEIVVTSNSHGFANGDTVYIASVRGMTELNGGVYTVSNRAANTYTLAGTAGPAYSDYTSNGTATKCQVSTCEVVITTSTAHELSAADYVYITGITMSGTSLNNGSNAAWRVRSVISTTKYVLEDAFGPSYGTYTRNGTSNCAMEGCEYFYFQSVSGSWRRYQISNCTTERIGDEAYTDVAPTTALVGRLYPSSASNCTTIRPIVPLTPNRTTLHATANALTTTGITAGHIGLAWAWYLIAPEFGYLFPEISRPATYETEELIKVVILMTDGEFNTQYSKGVVSRDSSTVTGNGERITSNAPNGSSKSQGEALCEAMKDRDIVVYTVGFALGGNADAEELMQTCATSPAHAYLAADGVELRSAFREIAQNISALRVSR
jgi:Flp pilus assembly protein TadG